MLCDLNGLSCPISSFPTCFQLGSKHCACNEHNTEYELLQFCSADKVHLMLAIIYCMFSQCNATMTMADHNIFAPA